MRKTNAVLLFVAVIAIFIGSPLQAQESDLLVTKSGPAEAAADTDVPYDVDVLNLGPDASAPITLTDTIPSGMAFVSATQDSGPAFSCTVPNPGDTVGSISCTLASMASGATASFAFVFHIPAATPPGTFFTNVATVATVTDPNLENDSGTVTTSTPFPSQADMFVTKSGPAGAAPDSDVVYTITVGNAGPDDAQDAAVSDTLPGTMTFVSLSQSGAPLVCSDPGVGNGGTITCTAANFAAGATTTLTLTGHIPAGTPGGTTFDNTATVSTKTDDPNEENNQQTTTLSVSAADVTISKTGPPTATAGDDLSYVITVTNNGPNTALNVAIDDPLPPNTTFVSLTYNSGPVAACSVPPPGGTGTVSCTWTFLAASASSQYTLVIEAGNTTSVVNTATVSTDSGGNNPLDDSSTATTAVTPSADLVVTKSGPPTIHAGSDINYTISATNNGPSDASTVALTDTVPANTTFASLTQNSGPTFACSTPAPNGTGTISCTIATFDSGDSATFTLVLHVLPSAPNGAGISNIAGLDATTPDPNNANDTATSTATVSTTADLAVTKSGPASVDFDTNITYTITATNNGPADAASVSLADTLPANTTFVSMTQNSGPTFACNPLAPGATGTITCTIDPLAAGASATFTLVLHVDSTTPDGSSIANTATISSTTTDPVANNSATTSLTVAAIADLRVSKTGPATVDLNSDITYVVTVTNDGPAVATSVTLTDVLPTNTTFVSISQTGPTFVCVTPAIGSTGTITCTVPTLANGASTTFHIVVHLPSNFAGGVTNTASVTAVNDLNGSNNAGTTAAGINGAPVPALSPWALALMALGLAAVVLFVHRP